MFLLDWRFESKFHLVAHDMNNCVALSFSLIYPYHISKLTSLSKYTHICACVYICVLGFPGSLVSKESACSAGDRSLIPGSERSSGEGNGNPLQFSCLESPMDRGAWWATVRGVTRVEHNLKTNLLHRYILIHMKMEGS